MPRANSNFRHGTAVGKAVQVVEFGPLVKVVARLVQAAPVARADRVEAADKQLSPLSIFPLFAGCR
jgi:hypothetical protein